jgi:hypothetical protein
VKVSCSEVVITDDFESSILGSNPSRRASDPLSFVSFSTWYSIRLSIHAFSPLSSKGTTRRDRQKARRAAELSFSPPRASHGGLLLDKTEKLSHFGTVHLHVNHLHRKAKKKIERKASSLQGQ